MEFSLDRFYQLNRKAIIWVILFGLIYVLRDFFTLIFLTFIISFFAFPASAYLKNRLRLNLAVAVVLVYAATLLSYIALYILVLPNVVQQAAGIRSKLPSIQAKLNEMHTQISQNYPNTAWLLSFDIESASLTDADVIWPLFLRHLNRDDNPVSPRLRGLFPDEIKRELDFIQRDSVEVLGSARSSIGTSRESDSSDSRGSSGSERLDYIALKERIIEIVNEIVIEKPGFFQPEEISRFGGNLRPEVATLLQVRDRSGLSDNELRHLNRLLLEQFYPNSILQRLGGTDKRLNHLIEQGRKKVSEQMPNVALYILKFSWNSLLAILFSFLIVFDYGRLSREVEGLAKSKLRDFFAEAGQPVVRFAVSVGQGFQAIVTIAFITTLMVIVALVLLRIPSIAFLAVITFVTSLVPVVGMVFEVVPVVLVALNEHGAERALWTLAALAVIHLIIGYVITPIIFGRQFKINVVAIIFFLFIGNQIAGVWGMILGVPIANYLLRDVFGVPVETDDK